MGSLLVVGQRGVHIQVAMVGTHAKTNVSDEETSEANANKYVCVACFYVCDVCAIYARVVFNLCHVKASCCT